MLLENEIGINRDDSLPGKGKYAVYGTYDRIRRFGEYPSNNIVSSLYPVRRPNVLQRREHIRRLPLAGEGIIPDIHIVRHPITDPAGTTPSRSKAQKRLWAAVLPVGLEPGSVSGTYPWPLAPGP